MRKDQVFDSPEQENRLNGMENKISPNHYKQGSIEPIDFIIANNMDFLTGNCIKYLTRFKYKNGLEDLKKAKFYLEKLISNYNKI